MATETHAAHGHEHGHGGHGGDHVPHVLDLKYYFGVFAALIAFTVITVAVSYVDLGSANLFIALLVATCKAIMVASIFMHLAFDKKFNAIIFVFSLIFLAIFIAFTMFDTSYRGLGGRTSGDKPADVTQPFAGTKSEAEIKAVWQGGVNTEAGTHQGKVPEAPRKEGEPAKNEGGKATEGGKPEEKAPAPAPAPEGAPK